MNPIDVLTGVPQNLDIDVCIIGSGPGGSAAARTLARAGKRVVVLEAGGYYQIPQFNNDALSSMKTLYHDHGKKVTDGPARFVSLQGRGLGGGTLVNSAISFRAPEKALQRWAEFAGLRNTSRKELDPYMLDVERTFQVNALDPEKGGANQVMMDRGLKTLGWRGAPIPRNAVGCAPCARCFFGCPVGAKRSTDKNFLPQAEQAGAKIFVHARAASLDVENGKVRTLLVHAVDEDGVQRGEFTVRAKHFVVSAGAVGTARLLLRQKLANSSGQVGKNFRCHPSTGALGDFDEKIETYRGVTQGHYSDQFFDEDILLETYWAPADAIATVLPGFGAELMERMARFPHFGAVGGMIRETGSGEVVMTGDGYTKVKYDLAPLDMRKLSKTLYRCTEVLLAAGAKAVYSDNGVAPVIRSLDELKRVEEKHPVLDSGIILEGNHPQGTCRMNADSKKGVVSEYGRSYDISNLWLMDSSVFPDALGVNPQITIAALSMRNAEYLAGNFG